MERAILSLRDTPCRPGGVLVIGEHPNPRSESVKLGHYYQGPAGDRLWPRLREVGLLPTYEPGKEDVALYRRGHGLVDLAKCLPPGQVRPTEAPAMRRVIEICEPKLLIVMYASVIRASTTEVADHERLHPEWKLAAGYHPSLRIAGVSVFLNATDNPWHHYLDAEHAANTEALREALIDRGILRKERASPSKQQLQDMLRHLRYERRMPCHTARMLDEIGAGELATNEEPARRNALLESFLLHARNLRDFMY